LMKAACTGCGTEIDPSPSGVTIDLPSALAIVPRGHSCRNSRLLRA
jgi:predicted RNA-binding Zn-ribbon protein involved in translation (DUF1610 family)